MEMEKVVAKMIATTKFELLGGVSLRKFCIMMGEGLNFPIIIVVASHQLHLSHSVFYFVFSLDVWGEQREGQDPEQEGKGAVLFVYVWLLVSIAVLIYLGNSTANSTNKLEGLRWALVGFANVCLVTMVLLVGLEAIEVEARELEEDGFYGQTPVLLFLTCFFALVQSIVFIGWTGKRLAAQQAPPEKSEGFVKVDYERSPSSGFMGFGV